MNIEDLSEEELLAALNRKREARTIARHRALRIELAEIENTVGSLIDRRNEIMVELGLKIQRPRVRDDTVPDYNQWVKGAVRFESTKKINVGKTTLKFLGHASKRHSQEFRAHLNNLSRDFMPSS